jgi:hypothetical protein
MTVGLAVVCLTAGCSGGSNSATPTADARGTDTSSRSTSELALTRAARAALTENFRLSVYVLWHNRIPAWASRSTRGPALAALRSAAAERRQQGIRVRNAAGGKYTIVSLRLDPSYARAKAVVRNQGRVVRYRAGRRLGRAIVVNDRARIELRRLGGSTRFVVWRVSPVR